MPRRSWRQIGLLIGGLTLGCAAHTVPEVEPDPATTIYELTVPLTLRNEDRVCVETTSVGVKPCMAAGRLRLLILSVNAAP